MHVYILVIIL